MQVINEHFDPFMSIVKLDVTNNKYKIETQVLDSDGISFSTAVIEFNTEDEATEYLQECRTLQLMNWADEMLW